MQTPILRAGAGLPDDADFGLRPLEPRDAARFAEALDDPEVRHWMHGIPDPYSEADALRALSRPADQPETAEAPYWAWAVVDTEDRLAGKVALSDPGDTSATLTYWLHPAGRGRGWMTLAVAAVAEWAAGPTGPGVTRLRAHVAAANQASRSVLERSGFRVEESSVDYRMGNGSHVAGLGYVLDLAPPTRDVGP